MPLRELGEFQRVIEEDIIYHKDLRGVEYVVADVGGRLAAPVYGMLQVQRSLRQTNYVTPDGVNLMDEDRVYWIGPPPEDVRSGIEWAGEWTVTYETFRDMGAAFAVALVLIYMLVVWEFGNFRIPALIMAPIPLTLLGIVPAHMAFFQLGHGGEFTATSMIGWIALAGIIVRNSILLVDFSVHEVQKGVPVRDAVIKACKTRTRPILITAFALVAGSSVILTDPIFQGMAISLASGVLVSTVLTLVVIPLGTIEAKEALYEVAAAGMPAGEMLPILDEEQQPEPAPAEKPASGKASKGSGFILSIWSKVAGALLMVFYAIRGLGLLLLQFLRKRRIAPAAESAPSSAAGNAGSASSGPIGDSGVGGMPATAGAGASAARASAAASMSAGPEPVPAVAASAVRAEPTRAPARRSSVPDVVRERILSRPEKIGHLPLPKEEAVIHTSEATAADLAAISAPIQKGGEAEKQADAASAPVAPTAVVARLDPTKKSKAKSRAASSAKTRVQKEAAQPVAEQETEAEAESAEQGARGGRKGGRRGIRLKDNLPGKTDLGLG